MSNVEMLKLNKHFMQHFGLHEIATVPVDCRPITLTTLPMREATSNGRNCLTVTGTSEYVTVRLLVDDEHHCWIRKPERRNLSRRIALAQHVREVADLYSVHAFLRYIADCGFVRQ